MQFGGEIFRSPWVIGVIVVSALASFVVYKTIVSQITQESDQFRILINQQNATNVQNFVTTVTDTNRLLRIGYQLVRSNHFEEALVPLEKLHALAPTHPTGSYLLSYTYLSLNKSAQGEYLITQLKQQNPFDTNLQALAASLAQPVQP